MALKVPNPRPDACSQGIEALRVRLEEASRHSPLYRWMRANRAAFAALLEETRPTWKAIAESLAAQGFLGRDGTPFKPETARAVWFRVNRKAAADAMRKNKQAVAQPAGAGVPAPMAPAPPLPPPPGRRAAAAPRPFVFDPEETADTEPEIDLRPATLKGRPRKAPVDGEAK